VFGEPDAPDSLVGDEGLQSVSSSPIALHSQQHNAVQYFVLCPESGQERGPFKDCFSWARGGGGLQPDVASRALIGLEARGILVKKNSPRKNKLDVY